MIKCPNCGSTAQVKLLLSDRLTTEIWKCGCGCKIERLMEEQHRIIFYPNGAVKYEENH